MSDLTTMKGVLEWAENVMSETEPAVLTGMLEFNEDDAATAEYLAYCARVTAIVERGAKDACGLDHAPGVCIGCDTLYSSKNIIIEAKGRDE